MGNKQPVKPTELELAELKNLVGHHYNTWQQGAALDISKTNNPVMAGNTHLLGSYSDLQFALRDAISKYGKEAVENVYDEQANHIEDTRHIHHREHSGEPLGKGSRYNPFDSVERVVGPIEFGIAREVSETEIKTLIEKSGVDPKIVENFINEQLKRSGNLFHNGGSQVNGKLIDGKFIGSIVKQELASAKPKPTVLGENLKS